MELTEPRAMNRAKWHLRANAPAAFWLLAVLVLAIVRPAVPHASWLLVHLLLLGAVTNAILVWSSHFSEALLRGRTQPRQWLVVRLCVLNAGILIVVGGVVGGIWPATLAGTVLVGGAVGVHGIALARRARAALPSRFGSTVRYYISASSLLPIGAGLGAALAHGGYGELHARLLTAHLAINLLGWIGLSVLGTLVTLLPTMLRTRAMDQAELVARRVLPGLLAGVVLLAGGALAANRWLAALGVLTYLGALCIAAVPLLWAGRKRPPSAYAPASALTALGWLAAALVWLLIILLRQSSWSGIAGGLGRLTPLLAVGFAAQILVAALTYLIPVVIGGGPALLRSRAALLETGSGLRLVLANLGLLTAVLPVPGTVRIAAGAMVVIGLGAFLPLAVGAALRRKPAEQSPTTPWNKPGAQPGLRGGAAAAGIGVVVLVVVAAVLFNPGGLSSRTGVNGPGGAVPGSLGSGLAGAGTGGTATAVEPTGHTTTVSVTMKDMRFRPGTVNVPRGDRLVIRLSNSDDMVHDLVTASGLNTGRIYSGESTMVDAGVITGTVDGWCSVAGHRQQGMIFTIATVAGPTAAAKSRSSITSPSAAASPPSAPMGADMGHSTHRSSRGAAALLDFHKRPGRKFVARDSVVPPLETGMIHRHTFTVTESEHDVAVGVRQRLWTFNGTAPGPTLHGRVGDTFVITLKNDGTMGHSIDFHAGTLAPDEPMRTISPGQSLAYTFTANRSGIWLYHCATMPMSLHIANGMFGAVIIDPPDLPPVDHEYVLIQSEYYLGAQGGIGDPAKIAAEKPDAVVFNGYPNQYDFRPLTVGAGERVRVWVLAAGPNRGTDFHVVGGQFDTVWAEGRYLLDGSDRTAGSQVLSLGPGQGGFVELVFPEAGPYPFVSHSMIDAERGAHGIFDVGPR